mmetsp:Transcript_16194/g.49480  ORF Transcript_16194/g.49480 Transcript_16194/m.49480 type:complete len:261 (+) Transcript_16194:914-1696(+)
MRSSIHARASASEKFCVIASCEMVPLPPAMPLNASMTSSLDEPCLSWSSMKEQKPSKSSSPGVFAVSEPYFSVRSCSLTTRPMACAPSVNSFSESAPDLFESKKSKVSRASLACSAFIFRSVSAAATAAVESDSTDLMMFPSSSYSASSDGIVSDVSVLAKTPALVWRSEASVAAASLLAPSDPNSAEMAWSASTICCGSAFVRASCSCALVLAEHAVMNARRSPAAAAKASRAFCFACSATSARFRSCSRDAMRSSRWL